MSEHDKPLEALGDETLEARVVAWVLGEASPFEAAELEERCGRDPELALFVRRMRELHGLIGASGAPAGPEWRLSGERRRKVTDLLGVDPPAVAPRRRFSGRWLGLAAACVMALLILGGVTTMFQSVGEGAKMAKAEAMDGRVSREIQAIEESLAADRSRDRHRQLSSDSAFTTKPGSVLDDYRPAGEAKPAPTRPPEASPAPSDSLAITGGLRSGDAAVTRDSIDAVLNRPGRVAGLGYGVDDEGPGGPSTNFDFVAGGALTGALNDDDSADAAGPAEAIASVVEAPATDGPVLGDLPAPGGLFEPDGDGGGGAGGMGDLANRGRREAFGNGSTWNAPVDERFGRVDGRDSSLVAGREPAADPFFSGGRRESHDRVAQSADDNDPVFRAKRNGEPMSLPTASDVNVDGGIAMQEAPNSGFDDPRAGRGFVPTDGIAPGARVGGPSTDLSSLVDRDGDSGMKRHAGGEAGPELSDLELRYPHLRVGLSARDALAQERGSGAQKPVELNEKVTEVEGIARLGERQTASPRQTDGGDAGRDMTLDLAKEVSERKGVDSTSGLEGEAVDELRRRLYVGESNYNLGKFDEAKEAYEEALRVDPYNQAARRGMERVAAAKSDYYRAAYDQTRAELLMEVDKAWEESVPAEEAETAGSLAELRDHVQRQENLVEDKRKALAQVVRQDKLYYNTPGGGAAGEGDAAVDRARDASLRFAEVEAEKIMLESQLATLDRTAGEPLLGYAAGLDFPENVTRTLQPQLLEAERKLEALKMKGLGADHPEIRQQVQVVEGARKDLNQGLAAIKDTLRAKLEMAKEQEERLRSQISRDEGEAVVSSIARQSFQDARADFESEQRLLEELRLREIQLGQALRRGAESGEGPPRFGPAPEALLDAMAELSAEAEPYSTFSLHVSDASFKLASAAMERGEVPDPAGIRPEEFYNAFDFGDPAPTAGEPVACTVEQCAHPAFPQRNLLRIAVRTGSAGRAASQPLNLTVLLDNSGSMEREDRAAGVQRAVDALSSLLKPGDTVTMAGFARQPRLLADRIDGAEAAKLNGVVMETPSEGGTNLEEALKLGGELARRQYAAGAQNRVVLFTDGAANLGDADPESLNGRVEALRQQGISFDAAGFGADGLNDRLLERLTRNGNGRYYVVDRPEEAGPGFARQLAGAFRPAAENVKVQVRFNPARVGRYKLIGFEEHRLNKEDFRNDAVDAAEMASEEAGVALYQFEILPQGEGEVGEVSVRFRDAASGRMVERSWTIPYDPQAPGFDDAKPSLQLAGLAAFAAEKLRHAPMAEAIDFGEMKAVMAGVKEAYGKSGRVAELERMMGRLD